MTSRNLYGSTNSPSPPSAIPPHVRPNISRHASASSTSSGRHHPHAQQREYVPSTIEAGFAGEPVQSGLNERWAFEHAEYPEHQHERSASRIHHGDHNHEDEEDTDPSDPSEDAGSEADWEAAKQRDEASKPKWRRASPRWLYPFVSGATLAMGMGMAPRSEIYINLACLAHPPQSPSTIIPASVSPFAGAMGQFGGMHSLGMYHHDMISTMGGFNGNDNVTSPAMPPTDKDHDISPADRWFYKIQHELYEYERTHRSKDHSPIITRPSPPGIPSSPSDRLPDPSGKPGQPKQGDHHKDPKTGEDDGEDDDSPAAPPYHQIDPAMCKRDPKVQAAAARLLMIMTVTMGILSALTTGYWGQMSDKIGRTKVMALMWAGLLINEICFILVATFPYYAPGGYKALLIGPTFEGLLGGISTLTATVNAYVSDTTPDGSRASIFARLGGIFMIGFACGPVIGSYVVKATGNIMTPFYLNVVIHFVYVLLILLVLPESLSKEARTILSKTAKLASDARKRQDTLAREWENETPAPVDTADPFSNLSAPAQQPMTGTNRLMRRLSTMSLVNGQTSKRQKKVRGLIFRSFRKGTAFLQPLAVFMPKEKEDGGKDWNMTITGAALFSMSFMMGVYQVKAQYTLYAFGWTSAQLGPYMSLLGFSRGFVMLVLLPLAMRIAKPYFVPVPTEPISDPSTSAFSTASSITAGPSSETDTLLPAKPKVHRPATLDLWTARLSLLWESGMYFILAFDISPTLFIVLSALITLSSGSNPASNSLALSFIPNSRESGKLFGGIAVLHALGSTLLGPLAFGTLFSATVGGFAPAIWVLAGCIQAISLGLMCFVRIPQDKGEGEGVAERGRSKRVKTVRSSSSVMRK